MIKLKDILNETNKKQNINEGKISDTINLLTSMAKNEVKNNFKELTKFMDIDKIEKDLPKVSIRDIESNLVKTATELKTEQKSEGQINEGLSDFINSIKDKIEDLIKNVTKFIQAVSRIPGMIKNLKYVKDIRGFMDYYSKNMTTDGVTYKGITNQMVNTMKTDVTEGIFTNNKSITTVFSMMFVAILLSLTLSSCTTMSIEQRNANRRARQEKQRTTQVIDTTKTDKEKKDFWDYFFDDKGERDFDRMMRRGR